MATAASTLPANFQSFDPSVEVESLGIRWKKWVERLENLFIALNITDLKRQRALLLYYGGEAVHNIYKTLTDDPNEEYKTAVEKLTGYFEPKINLTFEYTFRQIRQLEGESFDKFITRVRESAKRCKFETNEAREIKDQIVLGCHSDRLRRKALQDDPDLSKLISTARALELASKQAALIQSSRSPADVNKIHAPGKYSNRYRERKTTTVTNPCFSCGEQFPHKLGKKGCPAFNHKCSKCDGWGHLEKRCKEEKKSQGSLKYVDEASDSSDSDYVSMTYMSNSKKATILVKVNNVSVNFHVDSGSSVNIVNELTHNKLDIPLKKTHKKLYAYGSTVPLPLLGCFDGNIDTGDKTSVETFYVIKGTERLDNLLGLSSSVALGILNIVNSVSSAKEEISSKESVDAILDEYEDIFHGIGKLKDVKVKLHIDESVKPVAQKHRRVPFHLRSKVDDELDRLLKAGVIEPVSEATDWVSPVVIVPKRDSDDIRLCVDMTQPNKAIKRIRHVIPTLDEIRCDLNGAKYFSKMDLSKGYHQLELDESSRSITTFSTHAGLARFCRLNFGTSSATEIFHEEIRKLLQGIRGVINIHDDILVTGNTSEEHDKNLKLTFQVLKDAGLTLNKKKCIFKKSEVNFFGLVFNSEGVSPDPEKVAALKTCSPPTNKKELRSFLGMTNYSSLFIENYSSITAPLRELLLEKTKWKWEKQEQSAFDVLKRRLEDKCLLNYFNPSLKTELICDASPVGVGAILVQYDDVRKSKKVIAYASRALTQTEQRYSQIEREAVAILFGCIKFRLYLLGNHFDLYSDHKPLRAIFNNPRSMGPFRVERIRLKLLGFDFTVFHLDGSKNPTDYMSRHSLSANKVDIKQSNVLESHIRMVTSIELPVSKEDIAAHIDGDEESRCLKESILKASIDAKNPLLQKYKKIFPELSVVDGLILKGSCLYIPHKLRKQVISAAHDGHQGIVKTKQFLRGSVWYPGMNKEVEDTVGNCRPCLAAVVTKDREPLQMSELPSGPWDKVSTDFHGPLPSGQLLLVVIDQYSRYPVVEIVNSTAASTAIPVYDKIFGMFGIPVEVKSDNGSPFNSHEFSRYAKFMGFKHHPVTPMYPQANGLIERFNIMLDKVLATASVEGKNWKGELNAFLRSYRATPHMSTGKTPAELLFQSRPFRTRVPQFVVPAIDDDVRKKDDKSKEKMKVYADRKSYVKRCCIKVGDEVLVKKPRKSKGTPHYDPVEYTVTSRNGNMISAVRKSDGHRITRNSSFFKLLYSTETDNYDNSSKTDNSQNDSHTNSSKTDNDFSSDDDWEFTSDVEDNFDNDSRIDDSNDVSSSESASSDVDDQVVGDTVRRSRRTKTRPPRLNDYIVGDDFDMISPVLDSPEPVLLNDSFVEFGEI